MPHFRNCPSLQNPDVAFFFSIMNSKFTPKILERPVDDYNRKNSFTSSKYLLPSISSPHLSKGTGDLNQNWTQEKIPFFWHFLCPFMWCGSTSVKKGTRLWPLFLFFILSEIPWVFGKMWSSYFNTLNTICDVDLLVYTDSFNEQEQKIKALEFYSWRSAIVAETLYWINNNK